MTEASNNDYNQLYNLLYDQLYDQLSSKLNEKPKKKEKPADKPSRKDKSDEYIQIFFKILDNNRELIRIAHRGYITKLQDLFEAEAGVRRSMPWIRQQVKHYRLLNHCPLQYREDKYYNSERKMRRMKEMENAER